MDTHEFISNYDFQKLIRNLEDWLDFKRWGFKLTYSNPAANVPIYYIVYQSEQCKVRIRWEQDRPYESPKIYVNYGRNHAPPEESIMMWNGEKHWCWHEVEKAINFLDGLSPTEANKTFVPQVVKDFSQSSKGYGLDQPEYMARKNAYIWERYGQRIFNLFDIHQTDLWNQYVEFIRECGRISEEEAKSQGHAWVFAELYKVC